MPLRLHLRDQDGNHGGVDADHFPSNAGGEAGERSNGGHGHLDHARGGFLPGGRSSGENLLTDESGQNGSPASINVAGGLSFF